MSAVKDGERNSLPITSSEESAPFHASKIKYAETGRLSLQFESNLYKHLIFGNGAVFFYMPVDLFNFEP